MACVHAASLVGNMHTSTYVSFVYMVNILINLANIKYSRLMIWWINWMFNTTLVVRNCGG